MIIKEEDIIVGTSNSSENTWNNRLNTNLVTFKKENNKIIFMPPGKSIELNAFDEIVLSIVLKFLFMPVWLVYNFYNMFEIIEEKEETYDIIDEWIECGLVWKEPSVTGEYIRPTYALFELFDEDKRKYSNIPFNMLTHTIAEEQVMFELMTGINEICRKEITMPRVSELGLGKSKIGTNVIGEEDFRNPMLYREEGITTLNDVENKINKAARLGERITPELLDFSQFYLVKKVSNTGVIRKDYRFHIPDLCIPVFRKENGKPQSIAVEIELTNKRIGGYEETLSRYKNNNKYGSVYWLCNQSNTADSLRQAFDNIGGCGSCKMVLQEFQIPHPNF